jgi:dolichol-phosphate mannosyltransferase
MIVAVVPAYRAVRTIRTVVEGALAVVDHVIVVDDACPEGTAASLESAGLTGRTVSVLRHERNLGVGGAMKTGFAAALEVGADVIVKLDADGQMDPSFVPFLVELLDQHPYLAMVKGNRFASSAVLRKMPPLRLIGNSALSFIVKLCSGYWNVIDPTNGYVAIRADALRDVDIRALANRYFFEIDLLCAFGLRKAPIAELEMPPIYANERSSLSISRVFWTFPFPLLRAFLRRLLVQYVVTDINVGSLYAFAGIPLFVFGTLFGIWQWYISSITGTPRTSGTVVLALLIFILGFQLLLQAITFDVQFSPRTLKARVAHGVLAIPSDHVPHATIVGSGGFV